MINYGGDFAPHKDVATANLPAGAYVGKVLGAKVEDQLISGVLRSRLVLQLDVTEGEHKDHFVKAYEAAKGGAYPARFRGIFRITIPQKGDQYEGMNKRILQGAAWAFEDSNPGYKWDFDETKLKGLTIGFSVREADFLLDDAQGLRLCSTTEICRLESAKEVKAGIVKPVKKRELKEAEKEKLKAYTSAALTVADDASTEDLPF